MYLATKVEEWAVSLEDLSKALKAKPEDILKVSGRKNHFSSKPLIRSLFTV